MPDPNGNRGLHRCRCPSDFCWGQAAFAKARGCPGPALPLAETAGFRSQEGNPLAIQWRYDPPCTPVEMKIAQVPRLGMKAIH